MSVGDGHRASLTRWEWVVAGLSVLFLVVAAVIYVPFPFNGDTALFTIFAKELDAGAVLYRDIWDIKQPGIFWFFWAGGKLFGFDEIGIHTLELIYLGGSTAAIVWLLRGRYRHRIVAAVLPVLLLGIYLAQAKPSMMTQVEALIGPLLFGSGYLALRSLSRSRPVWLWFVAGLLGGLALLLKGIYLPILIGMWTVVLLSPEAKEAGHDRRILIAAAGVGVVVPIAATLALEAAQGVLGETLWTWFVYPREVLRVQPRPVERLVKSVGNFVVYFAPLVVLAAYRLASMWRHRRDTLTTLLWTWVVLGGATFVIQKWWNYLMLIVLVPLALLAAEGLDDLIGDLRVRSRQLRFGAAAILLASVLPAAVRAETDFGAFARTVGEGAEAYQVGVDRTRTRMREEIVFLESQPPGPIFVFGNPLITYLAHRPQATPYSGWSWTTWNRELWERVDASLERDPAALILVSNNEGAPLETSQDLARLLTERYQLSRTSPNGDWYALIEPPGD